MNFRPAKPGVAVAIAATLIVTVAAAGCSKNSSTTGAPSSPSPTSSTVPAATASARFVGKWHAHDATLDITPTTATRVASLGMGPCTQNPEVACSESDSLAVVSGNDTQLTLTVTDVSYALHTGQTTSLDLTSGTSTSLGDSIQLVWQAPGLLKQTVLKGFPGLRGGNPYWCGAGISQSDQRRCGA